MEKCVDSLLVGGERVEIIIIDDGSKDRTGEIADAYAKAHPSIVRVIHQENGGHGEGINQGLAHATGKYFKVVDSDDMLSEDFPKFLDKLEECDKNGGVDLVITNYFYVHTDGIGDRSINYKNALPEGRIIGWGKTRRFAMHQLITIHSATFRTELMRRAAEPLPKHVFYEDNLMVFRTLPHVERIYYMNSDLYRYWIGRPDQSVQAAAMKKRYTHHLLVVEKCFKACDFDNLNHKKLKNYLKHEMFILYGIAILYTRMNKTKQTDADLREMWKKCIAHDKKWGKHFRYYTPLTFICIPGKFGQHFCSFINWIANHIVKFN